MPDAMSQAHHARTRRRAISGSDVVGDSGQGYVHRHDCAEMAKKRNLTPSWYSTS
jgi:hypothetical protein